MPVSLPSVTVTPFDYAAFFGCCSIGFKGRLQEWQSCTKYLERFNLREEGKLQGHDAGLDLSLREANPPESSPDQSQPMRDSSWASLPIDDPPVPGIEFEVWV